MAVSLFHNMWLAVRYWCYFKTQDQSLSWQSKLIISIIVPTKPDWIKFGFVNWLPSWYLVVFFIYLLFYKCIFRSWFIKQIVSELFSIFFTLKKKDCWFDGTMVVILWCLCSIAFHCFGKILKCSVVGSIMIWWTCFVFVYVSSKNHGTWISILYRSLYYIFVMHFLSVNMHWYKHVMTWYEQSTIILSVTNGTSTLFEVLIT